jgi:hypothetical protein
MLENYLKKEKIRFPCHNVISLQVLTLQNWEYVMPCIGNCLEENLHVCMYTCMNLLKAYEYQKYVESGIK